MKVQGSGGTTPGAERNICAPFRDVPPPFNSLHFSSFFKSMFFIHVCMYLFVCLFMYQVHVCFPAAGLIDFHQAVLCGTGSQGVKWQVQGICPGVCV